MRASLLGALTLTLGCFSDPPSSSEGDGTTTAPGTSDGSTGGTGIDPDTSSTADPTSADDTAGPQSCADGDTCIAAPEGWMGPFVLATIANGAEPPACAAPYDVLFGVPLFADLSPGSVDCGCSC